MLIKKKIIIVSFLILSVLFIIKLDHRKFSTPKVPMSISSPSPTPLTSFTTPILVYHYVEYLTDEKDTIRKSLNTPPYLFIKQLETLKNAGYTFLTASELIDILDGKIKIPNKPVVLTFDDGYRDFYTDVFPILKKYNVKATAYIVSGFLDKPNYLLTEQLKEIARSDLIEIGAHTVTHASLKGLWPQLAKYEIEESKKVLEKLIDKPVVSFAYPNGSFDDQAIRLVKEAGFKSATTTIEGFGINHDNKYTLYRIHRGNKTDNFLLDYLEQK